MAKRTVRLDSDEMFEVQQALGAREQKLEERLKSIDDDYAGDPEMTRAVRQSYEAWLDATRRAMKALEFRA